MGPTRLAFTAAQAAAAALVLARFARGHRRRKPLGAAAVAAPVGGVCAVVPARDEEARLALCLEGLRADADVTEVLVVDDRSTDATARVARDGGARVLSGAPLPAGWAGKAWALHQGARAASGAWLCFVDADARPRPGLARALVALAEEERADLVSAGPRFVCDSAAERLLHPSMAATIPYRAGPLDVPGRQPSPSRAIANGQCMLVRREAFLAWGGWERVRGHLTEDVALARALRADGRRVAFADAADLLDVRMYESAAETWRGWSRSLMAPDVVAPLRQLEDLAVLWLTMGLPLPRVLSGRATALDRALVLLRWAIAAAMARSYRPRGLAFWLAPVADAAVLGRLTWSVVRPTRSWRGRTYAR